MKWRGIRRDSLDVSTDASQSLLSVNNRYAVNGELRLRRGMARSSVIKKDYAISQISAFSASQNVVSATVVDGDRWQGYPQPYSLWGDNPDYSAIPPPTTIPAPLFGYRFSGDLTEVMGGADAVIAVGNAAYQGGWPGGGSGLTFDTSSFFGVQLDTVLASGYVGTLAATIRVDNLVAGYVKSASCGFNSIQYNAGNIVFTGLVGATYPVSAGYYRCAVTSNGSITTHYINDVVMGTGTPEVFGDAYINMFALSGIDNGAIADVMFWDVCLSASDIAALAQRSPNPW